MVSFKSFSELKTAVLAKGGVQLPEKGNFRIFSTQAALISIVLLRTWFLTEGEEFRERWFALGTTLPPVKFKGLAGGWFWGWDEGLPLEQDKPCCDKVQSAGRRAFEAVRQICIFFAPG